MGDFVEYPETSCLVDAFRETCRWKCIREKKDYNLKVCGIIAIDIAERFVLK